MTVEYNYLCTYSCGHTIRTIAFVPVPAMSRVGLPGVCYECNPRRLDVEVVEWLETEPNPN